MERPKDLDLAQVLQHRVKDAGFDNVFLTAPSARQHPEFIVLSFGTPNRTQAYYDQTREIPVRVSVICLRLSEYDAMNDATALEMMLAEDPLDSENGSYTLTGLETTAPRPIPWDESGRFAWVFDIDMTIERNR